MPATSAPTAPPTTPATPVGSASDPAAAPRGLRSRWTALGVLSTGVLMTVLDGSIVTVAMPAIQKDLGFSPPDSAGSSTPT